MSPQKSVRRGVTYLGKTVQRFIPQYHKHRWFARKISFLIERGVGLADVMVAWILRLWGWGRHGLCHSRKFCGDYSFSWGALYESQLAVLEAVITIREGLLEVHRAQVPPYAEYRSANGISYSLSHALADQYLALLLTANRKTKAYRLSKSYSAQRKFCAVGRRISN